MSGAEQSLFETAVLAIEMGNINQLTQCLESKPSLVTDTNPATGHTLLHVAARDGQLSATRKLLERGADPGVYPLQSFHSDEPGSGDGMWTPLVQALNAGHGDVATCLAEVQVVPNSLWVAAGLGRQSLVDACFDEERQLRPESYDPGKRLSSQGALDDAFVMACRAGHVDVVRCLIQRGAQINGRDHWGETGLHVAAVSSCEIATLLLELGADVSIRDLQYDATPTQWARFHGKDDIAELLENPR